MHPVTILSMVCLAFIPISLSSPTSHNNNYKYPYNLGGRFWKKGKPGFIRNEFRHLNTVSKNGAAICAQPLEVGPCRASVRRYFYDAASGHCVPFTYGGCHGNENNFATKRKCMDFCQNLKEDATKRKYHYKRCFKEEDPGPCNSKIRRWFFNAKTSDCELFYFGGCLGNTNNFRSKKSCLMKCHPQGLYLYKKSKNFWKYRKSTPAPDKEFPFKEIEDRARCYLDKEPGPCKAYHRMFYYDAIHGRCRRFVFGGCGGNGNRFAFKKSCEDACLDPNEEEAFLDDVSMDKPETPSRRIRHAPDACVLPPVSGSCRHVLKRFYFDAESAKCRRFYFGGCGGNENNFETKTACQERCSAYSPRSKSKAETTNSRSGKEKPITNIDSEKDAQVEKRDEVKSGDEGHDKESSSQEESTRDPLEYGYEFESVAEKSFADEAEFGAKAKSPTAENNEVFPLKRVVDRPGDCLHVPESGECSGIEKRFFFNVETEACERFYYSGCGGNTNRFQSKEACEQLCLV